MGSLRNRVCAKVSVDSSRDSATNGASEDGFAGLLEVHTRSFANYVVGLGLSRPSAKKSAPSEWRVERLPDCTATCLSNPDGPLLEQPQGARMKEISAAAPPELLCWGCPQLLLLPALASSSWSRELHVLILGIADVSLSDDMFTSQPTSPSEQSLLSSGGPCGTVKCSSPAHESTRAFLEVV